MKRHCVALGLIVTFVVALLIYEPFVPTSSNEFLDSAQTQKHTILLLLAAQAVLISVLTSGLVEKPIPKLGAIIAAVLVFAAELGQLDLSILTGVQVSAVALIPIIGFFLTSVVPISKSITSFLSSTFLASIFACVMVWGVIKTKAAPLLVIILGEDVVVSILTLIAVTAFIVAMASGFGLLAVVQGRNTQPIRTGLTTESKVKRKRRKQP